jgi:cell division transport system permease protein
MNNSSHQSGAAIQQSRSAISVYVYHHLHAFRQGMRHLSKNPLGSLLTIAVLSITLVLPSGLLLLLSNGKTLTEQMKIGSSISVYVQPAATKTQIQSLQTDIKAMGNIAQVNYISAEDGLKMFGDRTGLSNILDTLGKNPLPAVFIVTPSDQDPTLLNKMVAQLSALPNVSTVKLDLQWVERLSALILLLQRFTYGLAIVLGLAVLLIVGNTIRLAVQHYHQEIEVIKLVGGSDRFIRRPFLYSGFLYGLSSGLFAAVMISFFIDWLQGPIARLAALYNSQFTLQGFSFGNMVVLLLISITLGFLGSWLAVAGKLQKIQP